MNDRLSFWLLDTVTGAGFNWTSWNKRLRDRWCSKCPSCIWSKFKCLSRLLSCQLYLRLQLTSQNMLRSSASPLCWSLNVPIEPSFVYSRAPISIVLANDPMFCSHTKLAKLFGFSFGTLLGPPLGSLIYHFSAFSVAPFVACALLFINAILFSIFGKRWEGRTLSISCIISTDGTSGEHEQAERSEDTVQRGASVSAAGAKFDPLAYLKFVTHPSILGVSLFGIMASAQITFFDVCLSLYLTDTFHLNAPKIGLMFVAHTLSNVTMTPFYGIAIDRWQYTSLFNTS